MKQEQENGKTGIQSGQTLMEQIYRSMYENSVYGVAVYTRIGQIIALNQRGREILGYEPGMPIEVDVRRYFYGEDEAAMEQELAWIAMGGAGDGKRQSFSHRCIRQDGTIIWLEGTRMRITMDDGAPLVISTFSDMTEQREAENRLIQKLDWTKKRRRMILELYDSIPIGVLQQTTSHPAVCMDVNRASVRLLGYEDTPKEFLEREIDFFSCIYAKDLQKMEDIVASLTSMGVSRPFEVRLQLPDGTIRWVGGDAQRLLSMDGNEILQFCFSDNTAKKSMEMALEEERRRNKLIAESTTSIILEYITATDTAYKFRNMRFKDGRISNYHLTIRNMRRRMRENGLIHQEDCDRFEHCLINGSGSAINVRMSNDRGQTYVWYRAQFSSFYEQGTLSRVLCIMDNIQGMMDMQSEKEILTELCHLVVSSKYEMVDLIDVEEGKCRFYITERERWRDLPQSDDYDQLLQEKILPMAYDERTAQTIRSLTLAQVTERLSASETVQEYLKLKEDDGFRWKLVEFSYLKRDRQKIFHMLSDVHDERLGQERLEQALDDANKANEAKNKFLANISHEIRTPMNAILGMSSLLLNRSTSRDMEEKLLSIQQAGNGLLAIINDILDFSKIEAGMAVLTETPYDFAEMLSGIAEIMVAQLAEKPVRLYIRKERTVPNRLVGDELKTRQILMNILGNAVKFTKSGQIKIHVGGRQTEDGRFRLEIRISDTGIGIRPEDLPKIFEAFGQADELNHYGVTGTGLGLPISRRLAQLMGGDMEVESRYGEGSVFSVYLIQKVSGGEPDGRKECLPGKKILVLEQDAKILEEILWNLNALQLPFELCSRPEDFSHPEDADYILLRRRTMKQYPDMNRMLPKTVRPVLLLEQNELVGQEFNQYIQIQIPLLGIQMGRALLQEQESGIRRPRQKKIYDVVMPEAKVLIVDDNEINRVVTEESLRPYQIQTAQAENGSQALQMALRERFQLVLMDQMMPGMDGVETAGKMRLIPGYEKTPIVALTADATEETNRRFQEAGFAGCLIKPVDMEQLEQVLRETLADYCQKTDLDFFDGERGNPDFYLVLLRAYKRDVESILKELPEAFYSGNKEYFTILVHRLKGASGQVGDKSLEEQAARMERLGKEDHWEEVTGRFVGFVEAIQGGLSTVEQKLKKDLNRNMDYADMSYRDSFDFEQVQRLKKACGEARYEEADKVLEEMAGFYYDERHMEVLEQMRELSDSLRYDELEQAVNGLSKYTETMRLEVAR